jgi:hypothetical protein
VIRYLDFESGQIRDLVAKEGDFGRYWLAASPDEKWLLYSEQPPLDLPADAGGELPVMS